VETAWRRRPQYYDVPWRGKWRTELGGALLGHAIHAHDMLCYILGPVKSVFARAATRVNAIEVEDCAAVSLEMADGSLASLSVTLGSLPEITRHRFSFSNLTAESNTRPYTNSGDPWIFTGDTPELAEQIEAALSRCVPLPEGFAGQFYRFHQALQQDGELPVTLRDARASLELITAMYHSGFSRQVVDLPIGPDHPRYGSWLPDGSL
jgi:predicted dehydrogenase